MTPFAKKVYKVVLSIPLGEVRTYKWVAQKAGKPKAYRAVGQILNRNPYPLIIPCHRVIAADGKLGGFAWGRKAKSKFLDLERQIRELVI
jgi:O-6-methylguanine DNA methyltransferase